MQEATWLTLDEVCQYLKIGKTTVYQLARLGKIPATKVGSQWRFNRSDIDNWMRDNRDEGKITRSHRKSK